MLRKSLPGILFLRIQTLVNTKRTGSIPDRRGQEETQVEPTLPKKQLLLWRRPEVPLQKRPEAQPSPQAEGVASRVQQEEVLYKRQLKVLEAAI